MGPFIDSMHSSFQEGLVKYDDMMVSFEDIFIFKGNMLQISCHTYEMKFYKNDLYRSHDLA